MNGFRWVAAVATAVAMPALLSAQQRSPQDRPADEAFKMVDAYVIANIQEGVDLTDEQFVKLLPLIKRQQTGRREFAQRRQRALRELNQSVRAGDSEPAVVVALDRLKRVEAEALDARSQGYAAIDAELDPIQQAKLRIFEFEVERRIRDLMRRVRGGQEPRQSQDRPRQPGSPR